MATLQRLDALRLAVVDAYNAGVSIPYLTDSWLRFADEGNVVVEHDYVMRLTDESLADVLDAVRRYIEYVELFERASRDIFVADAKKDIKATAPPEAKVVAITVRPQEGGTPDAALKVVKVLKDSCSSFLQGGEAVLEQCSADADEAPHGWHVHASSFSTYRPGKVKQFLDQKLKRFAVPAIAWVTYDNGGFRRSYMEGIKADETGLKQRRVLRDRALRAALGLPELFSLS